MVFFARKVFYIGGNGIAAPPATCLKLYPQKRSCKAEIDQKRYRINKGRDYRARHDRRIETDLLDDKRKRATDEFGYGNGNYKS